jgi:RNA polymerase sigma-70 factor, ECF subfamily
VSATQRAKGSPTDHGPGTLGNLLYADPTQVRVSEDAWVALVRATAAGDQRALRALYERTHRLVFTFLARLLNDRQSAEELTLDTFHAVWSRAARYDPAGGPVLGWIMNQARSRAIDRLRYEQRKKRTAPPPSHDAFGSGVADVSVDAIEDIQRGQALRGCLSTLTAGEREAIEAAFFLELSYAEVAVRLNQPLGTVKTRIRSGLEKLRHSLALREKSRA